MKFTKEEETIFLNLRLYKEAVKSDNLENIPKIKDDLFKAIDIYLRK